MVLSFESCVGVFVAFCFRIYFLEVFDSLGLVIFFVILGLKVLVV